jgi:hypothetical protein
MKEDCLLYRTFDQITLEREKNDDFTVCQKLRILDQYLTRHNVKCAFHFQNVNPNDHNELGDSLKGSCTKNRTITCCSYSLANTGKTYNAAWLRTKCLPIPLHRVPRLLLVEDAAYTAGRRDQHKSLCGGIKTKLVEQTAPCLRWVPLTRRLSNIGKAEVLQTQIIKEGRSTVLHAL